mgnify:CR=1 FL=1
MRCQFRGIYIIINHYFVIYKLVIYINSFLGVFINKRKKEAFFTSPQYKSETTKMILGNEDDETSSDDRGTVPPIKQLRLKMQIITA